MHDLGWMDGGGGWRQCMEFPSPFVSEPPNFFYFNNQDINFIKLFFQEASRTFGSKEMCKNGTGLKEKIQMRHIHHSV